jgi:hypothetical protein
VPGKDDGASIFWLWRLSEPLKSIHVRLSGDAHRVLCALAELNDKDNAEMLRMIAEESLLGRVHTLMLAAAKVRGLGLTGARRLFEGADGK